MEQNISGIFQNYLVFVAAKKSMKYFVVTTRIDSRKFNGMSEKNQTATLHQRLLIIIYYQT